jgi:transcriptional regulator with XRE-family HTH domain
LQISQNIRQARLNSGLSQEAVADKLGVKRTTFANWEKDTEPEMTIIKSIAEILGVNYIDIIDSVIAPAENKPKGGAPKKPEHLADLIEWSRGLYIAHKDFARAHRELSEAHNAIAQTNRDLAGLLKSNSSQPAKNQEAKTPEDLAFENTLEEDETKKREVKDKGHGAKKP